MKKILIVLYFIFCANANETFYYQKNQKIFLTPIKSSQTLQKTKTTQIDYYKTQKGHTVGIGKEIILKVKEAQALESLIKMYSMIMKKKLTNNLYLMEVNSTRETLNLSNQLYLDENVSYAQPNFIKKIDKR